MKTRMTDRIPVAIIGAGPFGLSVGARLRELEAGSSASRCRRGAKACLPEMLLRSAWDETSLSAPGGRGSMAMRRGRAASRG